MQHEFAAIVEQDDDWFVACAPEVPDANGQGRTREAALASLADAIALIFEVIPHGRGGAARSAGGSGAIRR